MVSLSNSYREPTIVDPDSMTSTDLFSLSLNKLSKTLPQTTSSRATISIYLRWLEIHRQEPTKLTEHWQNTLLHWTQSLRSRGFRESEIIAEVNKWKEANGPFRRKLRRYPPMPSDIGKAFEELNREGRVGGDREFKERMERLGDLHRPSGEGYGVGDSPPRSRGDASHAKMKKRHPGSFDGPPPPNYVCNRCGKKGHHLQVCPTNLDPAYDRPPDSSYECEICHARGKHFKSLCPKNTDPYSIYQKRKAKGIKTFLSNKGRVFCEWERELQEKKEEAGRRDKKNQEGRLTQVSSNASLGSFNSTPSPRNEKLGNHQKTEDMKSRLFDEGYYDIDEIMGLCRERGREDNDGKRSRMHDHSGTSSRGASPAPSMVQDRRKRTRTAGSDEITGLPRVKERSENSVDAPRSNKQSLVKREIDTEMADAIESKDGWRAGNLNEEYLNSPKYPLRLQKLNPDSLSIDESYTDSSDEIEVEPWKPPKEYSDFVQSLIRKRPEMSEIVNGVKRRPTAVDMWKKVDRQRQEEVAAATPEESPPYSPFKLEEEESRSPSKSSEQYVKVEYAQFDGACDERPVGEDKVLSRKNSTIGENRPNPQRKLSSMGKEAIVKVKELTTHVVKDLQTFKLRGGSPYRTSTPRAEELSPTKQKKKITDTNGIERITSKESLSSLRVNAASSALNLTEENIKGLAQDTGRTTSEDSEDSFGSLEVNIPGNSRAPTAARNLLNSNPFAAYAGRQSLEATQNHNTDDTEITPREDLSETPYGEQTVSDAADLPMQNDDANLTGIRPASQEVSAGSTTEFQIKHKTGAKKQDDESKRQRDSVSQQACR